MRAEPSGAARRGRRANSVASTWDLRRCGGASGWIVGPHARTGALPGLEIAVGGEIGVGLDDDTACDSQLGREHARRGQHRAGNQTTALDRSPKTVLEPLAQPSTVFGPKIDQEVAREGRGVEIGLHR